MSSSLPITSRGNKGALPPPIRSLPSKLVIGYATECNDGVIQAVKEGVNVIIWSFMEIHSLDDASGSNHELAARVEWNSLDLDCIRDMMATLDKDGYDDTIHLVSFGGWNGPHLDAQLSAENWFDIWKEAAGDVFHGIDWDLEGHDTLDSPTNMFSMDCLEKMGCISRLAKEHGYIIGMAPPQSYLDVSSPRFSRLVNLTEAERPWHNDFHYFGANVYAYLLAKYDDFIDFVSIQFYESYSQAGLSLRHDKITPEAYLESYVTDLVGQGSSMLVNFEDDPSTKLANQRVQLPLSKLVLGFANGWALDTGDKAVFFEPRAIEVAYKKLAKARHEPRGFMFWVIGEEGKNGIMYASGLNKILQTRKMEPSMNKEL